MIVASGFVGCLRTTYIINGGVQNLMGVDDRIRRLTPLAMRTLASTVLPRGGGTSKVTSDPRYEREGEIEKSMAKNKVAGTTRKENVRTIALPAVLVLALK